MNKLTVMIVPTLAVVAFFCCPHSTVQAKQVGPRGVGLQAETIPTAPIELAATAGWIGKFLAETGTEDTKPQVNEGSERDDQLVRRRRAKKRYRRDPPPPGKKVKKEKSKSTPVKSKKKKKKKGDDDDD